MSKLVFIAGKSGVGKDTIQRELINYEKDINSQIISELPLKLREMKLYTTRVPRENENSDYYNFLTEDEFIEKCNNNEIDEQRKYYMVNDSNNPYTVYYGSSISSYDEDDVIIIGNGAIDQLQNYIDKHLLNSSKSISMSATGFTSLADIYDLTKIKNNSSILVIYPFVTENLRLSRLIERSANINYYELYRRQYQDYEKFGDIYDILDSNAQEYLSCNDSCMAFVTFNKFSRITYCFLNNNIDYETMHSKVIPLLYKEIINNEYTKK